MTETAVIERALADAGVTAGVRAYRDLSGGCIHRVRAVTLADGRTLVAKLDRADRRPLFEEERHGLLALAATATVLVPEPLTVSVHDGHVVLLMSSIAPGPASDAGWRALGRSIAALHRTDAGSRYGFALDNHLGTTPQPNAWMDDWIAFNAERRLGWQVRRARDAGRLDTDERRRLDGLIGALARFIPARPRPALLHGDLWSGNALPTTDAAGRPQVAVIDPACSVGDGWADIAMMQLFGGFAPACFEAYAEAVDDHDGVPERLAVYRLYHLLNHLNLFGRGYRGQVMEIVGRLGC